MNHLIVIPAFNEVGTIAEVVAGARQHGPVLVVDDGSSDGTAGAARAAGAMVVGLAGRRGKGAALQAGAAAARARGAERMITLDGDGQHDSRDIPRLLAAGRAAPPALVVGRRPPSTAHLARGRWNACRVASFFIDWITDVPVRDSQSGFRSYPLELFEEERPRRRGFALETELLVAAARAGRPIVEVGLGPARLPVRPSRFHPLADGAAIAAYLALEVVRRGARELGEAAREVARVFEPSRRRARHAEMAEAGARYLDAPHLSGVAAGEVAVRHAAARVRGWWRHPRRRRATIVLRAVAVSPALLVAAAAALPLRHRRADLVTPLVDRFFSQDRLAAAAASDPGADRPRGLSAPPVPVGPPVAPSRTEVSTGLSLEP
jgi:hypothetical protein